MSAILDAFKVKEVDLDLIFASWTTAPIFNGNPKRDLPVVEWLDQIKSGCQQRKVPRAYWHKVAYHYMGKGAKARLDELKKVMRNLVGGKFRWNWKTFKIAMKNMGWDIDPKRTETFEVQSKPSGVWWIVGRGKSEGKTNEKDSDVVSVNSSVSSSSRPVPKKSKTAWDMSLFKPFPTPKRAATMSEIEPVSKKHSSLPFNASSEAPSSTSSGFTSFFKSAPVSAPLPEMHTAETTTAVAQAPLWLLNACQALDFLTGEHPKAMTALSAVLITVGSIPAIPAITAGAGGAFLASGTAHAIGSIAVGLGSLLQAQSKVSDAVNSQAGPGSVAKK